MGPQNPQPSRAARLTEQIRQLLEIEEPKRSKCFVAMWFGSDNDSEAEMDQLFDFVIKPAIENQGLSPYHVGRDLGADKLDDAILEAIDDAALVVVDLTHDPATGLRGSVIFEAGYAYQRKPVIWMCRDDIANSVPFDIRQFRQIRWNRNKLNDAQRELQKVIGERIGALHVRKEDHEISRLIAAQWKHIMSASDIPMPKGEGDGYITADQQRFVIFENLCDDITTRVKYKDMGLSQDEKYELIELVRGFRKLTDLVKSRNRVLGMEHYTDVIYPKLRASGWIA